MTACFLTLPGSVPFPTSIWIYSFLCLCYSILFHPDPTVSSFSCWKQVLGPILSVLRDQLLSLSQVLLWAPSSFTRSSGRIPPSVSHSFPFGPPHFPVCTDCLCWGFPVLKSTSLAASLHFCPLRHPFGLVDGVSLSLLACILLFTRIPCLQAFGSAIRGALFLWGNSESSQNQAATVLSLDGLWKVLKTHVS